MNYELWNTSTGNLIDTYSSVSEALVHVSKWFEDGDTDFVQALALSGLNPSGEPVRVANGDELVAYIHSSTADAADIATLTSVLADVQNPLLAAQVRDLLTRRVPRGAERLAS